MKRSIVITFVVLIVISINVSPILAFLPTYTDVYSCDNFELYVDSITGSGRSSAQEKYEAIKRYHRATHPDTTVGYLILTDMSDHVVGVASFLGDDSKFIYTKEDDSEVAFQIDSGFYILKEVKYFDFDELEMASEEIDSKYAGVAALTFDYENTTNDEQSLWYSWVNELYVSQVINRNHNESIIVTSVLPEDYKPDAIRISDPLSDAIRSGKKTEILIGFILYDLDSPLILVKRTENKGWPRFRFALTEKMYRID